MENNKNKKSVKFQGDMLNFCDFIQVFVFTTNHHLNISSCMNLGETQLVYSVKANLITIIKSFWRQQSGVKIHDGKLNTYFSVKCDFYEELYINLENFCLRKAICKLRISAHNFYFKPGDIKKVESCQGSKGFVDYVR